MSPRTCSQGDGFTGFRAAKQGLASLVLAAREQEGYHHRVSHESAVAFPSINSPESDVLDVSLMLFEKSLTLTNSSAHRITLSEAKKIIIETEFPINFVAAKHILGRSLFLTPLPIGPVRTGKEKVCTEYEREKKKKRLSWRVTATRQSTQKSPSNPSKKN